MIYQGDGDDISCAFIQIFFISMDVIDNIFNSEVEQFAISCSLFSAMYLHKR